MICSKWILRILGWKIKDRPTKPAKSVLCVAPHTSNWDFILGKLYARSVGIKSSFLMKKSWFFFPVGVFLRKIGGIPVDRSKNNSIIQQLIKRFEQEGELHVAITPEGTRKPRPRWKKGFYHIAKGANIPIELAYIDFKEKEIGVTEIFYPTDDVEKDLTYIYNSYQGRSGLHPEKFIIPKSAKK